MRRSMRQIERELARLEQTLGSIDEQRYLNARLEMEPQFHELARRRHDEQWSVLEYLERFSELHDTLPRRSEMPGEAAALKKEILGDLQRTGDRLRQRGFQLD